MPIDIIDSKNYLLPKNPVPLPKEDEALLNWREDDNSSTGEHYVQLREGKDRGGLAHIYAWFSFKNERRYRVWKQSSTISNGWGIFVVYIRIPHAKRLMYMKPTLIV